MRIRTSLIATTALALALITGCGDSPTRATDTSSSQQKNDTSTGVDCTDGDSLTQAEWTKHCADDAGAETAPDTDLNLKVGQAVEYDDGVKVSVDSLTRITEFGEYDDRPDSNETAFRVNLTFDNTHGKKPLDLEEFSTMVNGATSGGDAELLFVEEGAKDITGRVAPGVKTAKNEALVLDKEYGTQVIVTLYRYTDDGSFFATDPTFTGPIR